MYGPICFRAQSHPSSKVNPSRGNPTRRFVITSTCGAVHPRNRQGNRQKPSRNEEGIPEERDFPVPRFYWAPNQLRSVLVAGLAHHFQAGDAQIGVLHTLHTIHMDGAATYNLPFPFTNQVVSRTIPIAGLANVRCNGGHAWMNAEILVVPHPYYAVTDETEGSN
jgi:hypothetical protein